MKYCNHCGNELLDDAIICPKCGCGVSAPDKPQQPTIPNELDTYSGLSIIGFIFAIFSSLIGLIISIIANNEAKMSGSQKSLSLSKAGIIISAVMLGLGVLVSIIVAIIFIVVIARIEYFGVI